MSTIETNLVQPSTGTTLTLGASGDTIDASNADFKPKYQLGHRNLIINGAMQVAQRATQVTGVTTTAYHTVDRYYTMFNNLGTWTVDQSTDSPNGFSNSLKLTCTTADASPAAADYAWVLQRFEGQNLQQLAYGTADAKNMTLSFWVKSNKTGAASLEALQYDPAGFKAFSTSYTINSADTWEYKTILIPADTAGQIDNDNALSYQVVFFMNTGSDYTSGTHSASWRAYDAANRNPSNLGVGGAVSDYFAITGVQLEVGDVATPFEHESYGETLQKCLRYYEKYSNAYTGLWEIVDSANYAYNNVIYSVIKRVDPTITNVNFTGRDGVSGNTATATSYEQSIYHNTFWATPASTAAGRSCHFYGTFEADAEL